MATQVQNTKLATDVNALIAVATKVNAAIGRTPPTAQDAAIDTLDAQVLAATQGLTAALAKMS